MQKIFRNIIRCKRCNTTIESFDTYDFQKCKCGTISVDGGQDYLRRLGEQDDYEDLSEVVEDSQTHESLKSSSEILDSIIAVDEGRLLIRRYRLLRFEFGCVLVMLIMAVILLIISLISLRK